MENQIEIEPFSNEESEASDRQREFEISVRELLKNKPKKPEPICCHDCEHFDYYPRHYCKKTGESVVDELDDRDCNDFKRYED